MVRFVTAVPIGTPGRSSALRSGPLKKITLRALATATSMLKMVASGMRFNPINVPSRSATAITKRAREPSGKRITASTITRGYGVVDDAANLVACETSDGTVTRSHQIALGRRTGAINRGHYISSVG